MRKLVLIAAGCLILTGPLFAGGKKEAATAADSSQALSPLGTLPLVSAKATVKIFAQQPAYIVDWATNDFTVYLEKQTNVHVDWEVAPTQSLNEKRNLMLASGDYPDAFLYAGVTREEEVMYGSQGVFVPLNRLIDENAKELQRVFGENPSMRNAITTADGNIYAMPAINDCYHCKHDTRAYINTAWLKKLGLSMPTTTEEFEQVLLAFKNRDPNGNGMADEIPLTGSRDRRDTNVANFFINSFIYNDGEDRFYVDNGRVTVNYNKPEFREALRFLHGLYSKGLIAPESFTQDRQQMLQTGSNPKYETLGVGTSSLWWYVMGGNEVVNPDGTIRNRNYEALAPLKGPKGVRYAAYYPYAPITSMLHITNKAKNPALIVRWADLQYSLENTLYANQGPEVGKYWDWAAKGETGINGKQAVWKLLYTPPGNLYNHRWANMGTTYRSNDMRLGQVAADNPWDIEVRLYNLSEKKMHPYVPPQGMIFPPVYVLPNEVGELARLKTTINGYVTEAMARFIIGDLKVNTDWDSYVKQLDAMGLQRYIEINQKAYDRQYGKK